MDGELVVEDLDWQQQKWMDTTSVVVKSTWDGRFRVDNKENGKEWMDVTSFMLR